MKGIDIEKIKRVATEAAIEAGLYAIGRMNEPREISYKSGANDLVTDVDKKCESIIIERIKNNFPSHSILAEESGEHDKDKECFWVIDPLDGTTNYAHGFPVFCISIAFMFEGEEKFGVVYDPNRDEFFTAEKGKGAFLNNREIRVSKTKDVQSSLVATGFAYNVEGKVANLPYLTKVLQFSQAVRRAGSAAIDLCYVACGRFDGFWEFKLKPWDTAAAQLIVKEAGGKVTLLDNTPFDIFTEEIVATNGIIHEEFINKLTC